MTSNNQNDIALMQEVLEKTPSAIMVIDESGIIRNANPAAHTVLNEPKLEGRKWVEVISHVFRPRNDDGHEISTRDGRRCQVVTVPLSSGHLIQVTDLTETRLLQDKLSHMERLSSLGRMAASLAHQIRTPLSAAILYAANLGNANLQAPARKRFQEKLMSRLEALEAQVSDILMFARSNEQTAKPTEANIVVDSAANNVTAVLTKGEASLDVQIEDEGLVVMCNPTALTGALSNLIANAVEAGGHNIILNLSKNGDKVVFAVANDGPRIPEELREKIFEPFYTSKPSGTGLGLAVVTAVTKVHQGILRLDSWDDTFATVFEMSLPIYNPEQDSAQQLTAVANAEGSSSAIGTGIVTPVSAPAAAAAATAASAASAAASAASVAGTAASADGAATGVAAVAAAGVSAGAVPSSAAAGAAASTASVGATSAGEVGSASSDLAASATEILRASSKKATDSAGGRTGTGSVASAVAAAGGAVSGDTGAARDILSESAHGRNGKHGSDTAIGTGSISGAGQLDYGSDGRSFDLSGEYGSYDESGEYPSEYDDLTKALRSGSSFAKRTNSEVGLTSDGDSSGMNYMPGDAFGGSRQLPKTAAGISSQDAHAANSATSEAFAAYARRHQSIKTEGEASSAHSNTFAQVVHTDVSGYNQVEVNVGKSHKLLDGGETHTSKALESTLNVDGSTSVKDNHTDQGSAVGAANAVFAAAVRSQKRRNEEES